MFQCWLHVQVTGTFWHKAMRCVTCGTFYPLPINGRSSKKRFHSLSLVCSSCTWTQAAIIWQWCAIILQLEKLQFKFLQSKMCHNEKADGWQAGETLVCFFSTHPDSIHEGITHHLTDISIHWFKFLVSSLTWKKIIFSKQGHRVGVGTSHVWFVMRH